MSATKLTQSSSESLRKVPTTQPNLKESTESNFMALGGANKQTYQSSVMSPKVRRQKIKNSATTMQP